MAFASFANRFVPNFSNCATNSSNPQSLTSCQCDISSSGTSSSGVSLAAFTTSLVCGTFSPKNASPSPYSPGPVLKNRINTCR